MANCDVTFDIRFKRPYCNHDPLKTQEVEGNLRAEISILREKIKIIRQETVRQWDRLDPKWLMEELDR